MSTGRYRLITVFGLLVIVTALAGCGRSETEKSEFKIDLGKAEVKNPDPKKLIKTQIWGEVPANQLAFLLKDGKTKKDAEKLAKDLGGSVVGEIEYINLYQLETKGSTEADLKSALDKARKAGGVASAFPNTRLYPSVKILGKQSNPFKEDVYSEGNNGRHYQMTGVKSAWTILKASGVKTSEVSMGIADNAVYNGSDEVNLDDGKSKPKMGKVRFSGLDARMSRTILKKTTRARSSMAASTTEPRSLT